MEDGSTTIDSRRLSTGLYLVKVSNENQTYTRKLIKK
ncbi:T9SS type A sorting domain-containing protein [Aquimarina addita]